MGCQFSKLVNYEPKKQQHIEPSLNFSNFIKAHNKNIFQFYLFGSWVSKSPTSSIRKVIHKQSSLQRIVKIYSRERNNEQKAMNEINALKRLDHPNIAKLYEYFVDDSFIYIVLEMIDGSPLFDQFHSINDKMKTDFPYYFQQLLTAVEHCHSNGVVHRNLTSDNILIAKKTDEKSQQQKYLLKLIDFSQAFFLNQKQIILRNQEKYANRQSINKSVDQESVYDIYQPIDHEKQSPRQQIKSVQRSDNKENIQEQIYIPVQLQQTVNIPDFLLNKASNNSNSTQKPNFNAYSKSFALDTSLSKYQQNKLKIKIKRKIPDIYECPYFTLQEIYKQDIWYCGIILYIVLIGKEQSETQEQFRDSLQKNIQEWLEKNKQAKQLADLLQKMLSLDPKQRPMAFQCLNHNFFTSLKQGASQWKLTMVYKFMHDFKANHWLKSLFSMYITRHISTAKDQGQFFMQFCNLDTNKDGKLQYQELVQGMMNYFNLDHRMAEKYVDEIFQQLDKNKSGCLEYSEFLMGTMNVKKVVTQENIRSLFASIDINNDGYISKEQLKLLLDEGVGVDIERYLNFSNSKSKITFEQFQKLLKQLLENSQNQ